MKEPTRIVCPRCLRESSNTNDIAEEYCGHCCMHHSMMRNDQLCDLLKDRVDAMRPAVVAMLHHLGVEQPPSLSYRCLQWLRDNEGAQRKAPSAERLKRLQETRPARRLFHRFLIVHTALRQYDNPECDQSFGI